MSKSADHIFKITIFINFNFFLNNLLLKYRIHIQICCYLNIKYIYIYLILVVNLIIKCLNFKNSFIKCKKFFLNHNILLLLL